MKVYLDASALVSFFVNDPFTSRIRSFLDNELPDPVVSDFAAAEFASATARLVRMRHLTPAAARTAFSAFDTWTGDVAESVQLGPADVASAAGYLRRLDLTLRTPDALNIAIARRADAALATFDDKMAACAKTLRCLVAVL